MEGHICFMNRFQQEVFVFDSYVYFEGLDEEEQRNLEANIKVMSDDDLLKEVDFCDYLWTK